MGRSCSTNGGRRNANGILVVKSEERRPLGRPSVGGWTILK
jgi:hypothetical protein